MGFNSWGNPQVYIRFFAHGSRDFGQQVQFGNIVNYNPADSVVQRHPQFGFGFVIAVEINTFGRETHLHGGIQFPSGHHINTAALLHDNAANLLKTAGFAGISYHSAVLVVFVNRFFVIPQGFPDNVFIHNVKRCAVTVRKFDSVEPADCQVPVLVYIQSFRI